MRTYGLLILALLTLVAAVGCGNGDVQMSDIQKNAKDLDEASKKDPGTGGNRD